MGLVGNAPHSAEIEALEVGTFLSILRSEFDALLRNNMDIEVRIYRHIVEILAGEIIDDKVRTRTTCRNARTTRSCSKSTAPSPRGR